MPLARYSAWRQRWSRLSIARRMAVGAVAMTLTFTFFTGLLSFAITWKVIRRSITDRLETDAARASQQLEGMFADIVGDVASLSQNSLFTNALVDSQGREQYVTPFIRDFRLTAGVPSFVALCDFRGRQIASNQPGHRDFVDAPWLGDVMGRARAHGEIFPARDGERVLIAYPVVYPSTGLAEGMLIAELKLRDALAAGRPAAGATIAWRLLDGSGHTLSTSEPDSRWSTMLTSVRRIRAPAPLDGAVLALEVGLPRSRALGPLALLAAGYVLGAALLALAALALSRSFAHRVTRPLRVLGDAAGAIAAAGTFGMTVPVGGPEETARLGAAFDEMLKRLRDATETRYAVQVAHTREAETALHSAHEAMEQATEAIAILDRTGTFTYANRAACRLAQRDGGNLVGVTYWEFDPSRSEAWWEQLWSELEGRGSVLVRGALRQDGRPVEFETSFTAFQLDGCAYCVATARDVTDRTQAELMRRMVSLGTLAAGVAHEINNPLAYVTANVEYVAREIGVSRAPAGDAPMEQVQQALADCRDGLLRVRDIVRSLSRFSRHETAQRVPVDVHAELEFAIALARNEMRHRARLETHFEPVPHVLAAEHELGQVFVNLLVNAAQSIREGRSESNTVRVWCGVNAAGQVVVEISDTGEGIPAEVRPRIFEPFFTTKPVGAGTGLGLSTCHGIVVHLGGRIEVESEVARGSTFRVLLPAAAAPATVDPADHPGLPETIPPARCRVLVVDDEALVGRAVTRMMAGEAHVTAASSVREALALLDRGEQFDAIVCDLMMPDSSGMQFHSDVRARSEAVAGRIGFITGGAFTSGAREFLDSVGNPVLEKPFEREAIRAMVARLSAGAAAAREAAPAAS